MRRILCIRLLDWPQQRPRAAQSEHNRDPITDRAALERLAEELDQFSPIVGVEEFGEPDSLLLDITGLDHLFGGEDALVRQIHQHFTARGLHIRLALAPTLAAAWALTHAKAVGSEEAVGSKEAVGSRQYAVGSEERNTSRGREPARLPHPTPSSLSSSFSSSSSAYCLLPTAYYSLPISALRLPDEVVEGLRQLGVHQIEQLAKLPRQDLSSRFGPELLKRWDQLTGRAAEAFPAHQPPPEFQANHVLEYPTTRREALEQILQQLINQVTEDLARSGRGALRLECRLDCVSIAAEPIPAVRVSVGLFQATASAQHLFGLAAMQLERLSIPAPITAVSVKAVTTARLEYRQRELFENGSSQLDMSGLASLIDRLSSRLGRQSVSRVRLLHDAQPEWAYHFDPLLTDSVSRRFRRKSSPSHLPPRPLRLLRRPLPLVGTFVAPDGPPAAFRWQDHTEWIAHCWGPERIEIGWWRHRAIGRDYYRVETATGRRFWLFRRLRDARWFLHGVFE